MEFRLEAIAKLAKQAGDLTPYLVRIRPTLSSEDEAAKVRLHLPLLSSLLRERGMGGSDWIEQFIHGFLMIREAGEPGAYNECSPKFRPMSRDEFFETAKGRRLEEKTSNEPHKSTLREDGCRDYIDTQKKGSFGLEERRWQLTQLTDLGFNRRRNSALLAI